MIVEIGKEMSKKLKTDDQKQKLEEQKLKPEELKQKIDEINLARSQFHDFVTNHYKLSYFKSPTGLSFVLLSSKVKDQKFNQILFEIYAKYYVEYVVKNPLIKADSGSIKCPNFSKALKLFFASLK